MEACHAEIMLIRPPAPGRERALAGPRARAALRKRGPARWAAHERASSGQVIVMRFYA